MRRAPSPGWKPVLRDVTGRVLFWTAVGVAFALPALGSAGAWVQPLWRSLAQWWGWGVLAPLIASVTRALDAGRHRRELIVAGHLVSGLLISGLALYLSTALAALFGIVPWGQLSSLSLPVDAWRSGFLWGLIVYGLIAGVELASLNNRRLVASALRAEQIERAYADARLHALRLQLDPHFLFNAMNTISAEIGRDARTARAMIEHLAALLRLSLDKDHRGAVPLADELAMLEHYLAIQRARFGDRLRVRIDVPERLGGALVPSMLLQPLVENAVRHGLAPRRAGGLIEIAARLDGRRLLLSVADDGVGLPAGWVIPPEGVGLAVTRERVAQFGPEGEAELAIGRRSPSGTIVVASLPFLAGTPEAHD